MTTAHTVVVDMLSYSWREGSSGGCGDDDDLAALSV